MDDLAASLDPIQEYAKVVRAEMKTVNLKTSAGRPGALLLICRVLACRCGVRQVA